jgi:hypothetical protein
VWGIANREEREAYRDEYGKRCKREGERERRERGGGGRARERAREGRRENVWR